MEAQEANCHFSEGRLVKAKSIGNGRMTHRVEITTAKEMDGTVKEWLKAAYDRAG